MADAHGRTEPPLAGDEAATLLGFLDHQRATFAWKCFGLDGAALAAHLHPTTMTLGGLLKHLTLVEDSWLDERLLGSAPRAPWDTVDWAADPDWEWRTAAADPPEQLRTAWQQAVERSRRNVARVLATEGLDRLGVELADGRRPSLRWVLVHLIEEYARHNGHADLLREAVDGVTGE
jgi:uncharacterized damage-inducible protein DinB